MVNKGEEIQSFHLVEIDAKGSYSQHERERERET